MKPNRSHGLEGITSEILMLLAEVLVVSLTYIINSFIVTGKFPSNWKVAKVVPLNKKGDRKALQNYRPVAQLCTPGMVLERVIDLQIEKFFENNELFGKFQFGFRNKKSTISEILTMFDSLLEAKDMKKEILVVLYDLSSAFDTVSHEVLLTKLKIYGINEHSIKWVKSYLENRKQMVTICGQLSSTQHIEIGTPQGSRLSPLYFVCIMADMNLWTEKSKLSNFADDTQSIVVSNTVEETLETTKKEANSVISFFECNNLVNNANKAAILYNSKGKGKSVAIENIGGERKTSWIAH